MHSFWKTHNVYASQEEIVPSLNRREWMADPHILVRGVPFVIDEEIGSGLHSFVYGGRNLRDGRPVAIKVVNFIADRRSSPLEGEFRRQSFWKELEMLLYLQPLNPYVIRLLTYECNDQYGVIVMERGDTFRDTLVDYILTKRPIPPDLLHRFWSQMVEAIYFMHRIGIVHGDCKPENFIQLGPDGTALRLIDMGISFQLPPNVTCRLKTVAGTPDYMSPEMINSRVGRSSQTMYGYKADIWALGVILFEMAFGFRPLQGLGSKETKISFLGQLQGDIPIPAHSDQELRDILKQCLRSNPRRRPTIEQVLNHSFLTRTQ